MIDNRKRDNYYTDELHKQSKLPKTFQKEEMEVQMLIENTTNKGVDLIPVSSRLVTSFRTVFLDKVDRDEVNEVTENLIYLLEAAEDKEKPIILFIRATEGTLDSALTFIDYLKSYEDQIILVGQGNIGFAGSLVLASGSRRYVLKHTKLTLYDASIFSRDNKNFLGFNGKLEMNKNVVDVIEEATGITSKELEEMKEEIDIWKAKDKGVIDEVLSSVSHIFRSIYRQKQGEEER